MSSDVVIVNCDMMTSVGLSAAETSASTRARVMRVGEIEWRDHRHKQLVVSVVPNDGLPDLHPDLASLPLSYREARMLVLAGPPLQRLTATLPDAVAPPPLILGLPELHTTVPIDSGQFLERLGLQARAKLNLANSDAFVQGRASTLLAVREAVNRLKQGSAEFVLVGGVDSYIDLYVLGTLDMQGRIRTERAADGFAPGEGSGFLLLARHDTAEQHGMEMLACVRGLGTAIEPGHFYSQEPYRGDGLSEAFETCFDDSGDTPPTERIYATFNGERYWAKELGVAVTRNQDRFHASYQMEHPAECFGDLGAASGGVMMGLASLDMHAGQLSGPALVYCSSDYGDRAAVLVTAA